MKKEANLKEENKVSGSEKIPAVKKPPFKVAATKAREIRLEPNDGSPIMASIVGGVYRITAVSKEGRWGQLKNGRGWIDLSGCTVIE